MSGKKISWVWEYFKKASDGILASCSICGTNLSYHNSTTSLSNHLKQVHKKEHSDKICSTKVNPSHESSEVPIGRKRKRQDDFSECTFERQEAISWGVARLIASNMLPISFASSQGFREFMRVVEPGYKVPCEQSVHSRLKLLYNDVKKKIIKDLAETESAALSVDEWSSRTQDCYISVEAQYIDSNNELCTVTLSNKQLEGRPNADNISSAIESVLSNWDLSHKTQAVTHDSASVMNAAARKLLNVQDSIKCSAHMLQLVIKDAFSAVPDYEEICKKGRNLAAYFRRSNKAKTALTDRQVQLGIKENRLVQSCETRWNSKYHMCESLILNRNAIGLVLADRSVTKICDALKLEIPEKDWTDMCNLVRVLKPFDKATTVLCGGKHVTLSLVRPLVSSLIKTHMTIYPEDDKNLIKFKETARESLSERFLMGHLYNEISAQIIAAFFDPRYKNLNHEEVEVREMVFDFIRSKLQITNVTCEKTKSEIMTDMDYLFDTNNQTGDALSQMECYISEPQTGHNIQPLIWWKNHCGVYPELFRLAKQYLCIPATSAESERTFSIAGNIVSARRSCLLPENVNILTFLFNNRRFLTDNDSF